MVPTYECAGYVRETLDSVLAQDPGADQMQIEVVDDASTDDLETVVRAYGDRVEFFRQPRNVGHIENMNTCLRRSRGELVHVLHGDDAVRPGFYEALGAPFADASVGAAFCRFIAIDEDSRWTTIGPLEATSDGILEDWLERISSGQRIQTPSMVVRRSVYERIGGFDSRAHGGAEDWEMWTRVAASTRVWHVVEPLALYRIRSTSMSRRSLRTGEHVAGLRRVVDLNASVLPPNRRAELTAEAREIVALTALRRARRFFGAGDADAGRAQVRQALRTSRSAAVLERTIELAAVVARRRLLTALRSLRARRAPRA
jgi:glycosyltransferase involved in cell wall biosynthesis